MGTSPARGRQMPRRIRILQIILLLLVSIITYGALVLPLALRPAALPLQPGDVAPNDFQAQDSLDYVSEVKTEELRNAAVNAVPEVYALPEPSIARGQIEKLRAALQYISLVREDEHATAEQKSSDIASLSDISLPPETIEQIIELPEARWEVIYQESLSVLEQVMRGAIRDRDLESVRRTVPSLVSLALNEEQVALVAELVTAFVTPNSIFSEELTEEAREAAREAVEPFIVSYKAGETIVLRGQIISLVQFEALQKFGYIEEPYPWQEYAGAGALVLMLAAFVNLYFSRRKLQFLYDGRSLVVIALIFVLFIVSTRAAIPNRTVLPYAFPLPALGLLIGTLFGMEAGVIFSLVIALLVPYSLPNTLDLIPYY
ncbi:MAG TPA: hypothetical protein VKE92_02215, partial [Anaerolineales bacterium]|nr:hypothetical protein [Anaerolineales bacterium]